ncbi:MAG: SDR family NAD(P)-dependent oxidoreductase [Pseudolabrys sp.]
MQLGLTGKVALISGGTSGIGLAIAQTLAAEGCNVAICGRDKARLDRAVAAIKSAEAKGFVADICKPADVAALVDNITKAWVA